MAFEGRPIVVGRGTTLEVGPERPRGPFGWSPVGATPDGLTCMAYNDGKGVTFHDVPTDELLWRNPRYLSLQVLRHPAPPTGVPADGWNALLDLDAKTHVTLERDGVQSVVAARDVVAANRDDLIARFRIEGDS